MKRSIQLVLIAVVSCLVGSLAGPAIFESVTNAQPPFDRPGDRVSPAQLAELLDPQKAKGPRYQISAYGHANGHGCYVIDMVTGRFWHSMNYSELRPVGSASDVEQQQK